MQYTSPLSLLDARTVEHFSKKDISLAKKKMLAELELNGGNSVVINNRELTKNDIIIFFDSLQLDENLQYHVTIANDFVLRRFLEDNVIDRKHAFKNEEIYVYKDFIEWVSPYFFTSFNSFAQTCLHEMKDTEWVALLAAPLLMNAFYTEKAWNAIEKIIITDLEDLYDFDKNKGATGWEVVATITNFRYISMLKRLPKNRFDSILDEYALVTMQCAIYVFNGINRSRGTTMVENALVIAGAEHIKKQIIDKLAEMEAINRRADRKAGKSLSLRKVGFLFIYVFIVVASAIYNASHNDAPDLEPAYFGPVLNSAKVDSTTHKTLPIKDTTFLNNGQDAIPPQQEAPPAIKKNRPSDLP